LKAAGIDDRVKDVPGGSIVRDKKGRVTGVFKDNAQDYVYDKMPPRTPEQEDRAPRRSNELCCLKGVTSVHNMSGFHEALERAKAAGK